MPTSKANRKPPARRFEEYIFTRSQTNETNLVKIPTSKFALIPGSVGGGGTTQVISSPIPLGFNFSYDGVTYNSFAASSSGWIALVDPAFGTFVTTNVITSGLSYASNGVGTIFPSSYVLIAPWFDNLTNVTNSLNEFGLFTLSAIRRTRIQLGLEVPPTFYDTTDYGVKYFYDTRSTLGRRTIVRWNSVTAVDSNASTIRFEVVIYENGLIEFRYAPRNIIKITATTTENAAIGIFMLNGTNRFRDMSLGLGYKDDIRKQYKRGGVEYSSGYSDTNSFGTAAYTCNLTPIKHWPGSATQGAIFSFLPPPAERVVLPRQVLRNSDSMINMPLVARTGDERLGTYLQPFDDRKSITYLTGAAGVSYPTRLRRFYNDGTNDATSVQNLFAGTIELTASIANSISNEFQKSYSTDRLSPFNEVAQYEQVSGDFFATGTNISDVGFGLTSNLKSKTQIRMSFPVNLTTQFLGFSSSILYYNLKMKQFQTIPYWFDTGAATGFSDLGNPIYEANNLTRKVIETARGFTAWGSLVVSGALGDSFDFPTAVGRQTSLNMGREYTQVNGTEAVVSTYEKSVTKNIDYDAKTNQYFRLPINKPFLIEKAVIELPIAAGDGWFHDITETNIDTNKTSFDVGGPGLTVSLMNQVASETGYYRDVIMSGTITHSRDNFSQVVISNYPDIAPFDSTFYVRPRGFLSLGTPSAIITPVSSSTAGYNFTGSVIVPMQAAVSNGVTLKYTQHVNSGNSVASVQNLLTSTDIVPRTLNDGSNVTVEIAYIDAIGRAQTGFEPSGRSIFGKEFFSLQNQFRHGAVRNPLYVSSSYSQIPAQMQAALTGIPEVIVAAALPLGGSTPSPYLVLPGDTLVLAVSKTRPHMWNSAGKGLIGQFSASIGQDMRAVQSIGHNLALMTGTINITLYGSELCENSEFHDTLNQPLASDAIHEIFVGGESVTDQFDINYRGTYFGSTSDDFITGSLLITSKDASGKPNFITGSRGRVFSKLRARLQSSPSSSPTSYEAITNSSKAFRLQPWYELVGNQRTTQISSLNERFYDSMMPSINGCFNASNAGIFTVSSGSEGGFLCDPDPAPCSVSFNNVGFIVFDSPDFGTLGTNLNDKNWSKAYPFEPRYSRVARQQRIEKSFIADYTLNAIDLSISPIRPKPLDGFYFIFTGRVPAPAIVDVSPYSAYQGNGFEIGSDISIRDTFSNGLAVTGSARSSDIIKAMYGFGDNNMLQFKDWEDDGDGLTPIFTGSTYGSNHYCEFKGFAWDKHAVAASSQLWGLAPVIRGWKYGVYSGLPAYSNCVFRRNKFGQLRDMLEQRLFTKYYTSDSDSDGKPGLQQSPVIIKFVDFTGRLTSAESTWSQNLSFEATSSIPFIDGLSYNRPPINVGTLNASLLSITTDDLGNVTL